MLTSATAHPICPATWAALDLDSRIFALAAFEDPNDANVWFCRLQAGWTVVRLDLLPDQVAVVGDLVELDEEWTGRIVSPPAPPVVLTTTDLDCATQIAGLHAVLDAAARCADAWVRHALLEQAVCELRSIHHRHADRVTAAALEAA